MNTRTEVINGYTYCAYCGKELKNNHYGMCPEPPVICNCEKAKEELGLYDKLKNLYNTPLAESLIEKKMQIYRNCTTVTSTTNQRSFLGTIGVVVWDE